MSLNLQKELLEFQKELKELNSYSSEMKRMEKGLAEAEALTKAATKAAEGIRSKHLEHLNEIKEELNSYLNQSTLTNKQILEEVVNKLQNQITKEVERIQPLVDFLEEGVNNHIFEYDKILKSLSGTVEGLGSELTKYLEELQSQNKEVLSSLSSDLHTLHSNQANFLTGLLQEKTELLISAGQTLQNQSRTQGEELSKTLSELYNATAILSGVSEAISKTNFTVQLQNVERELNLINTNTRSLEDTLKQTGVENKGNLDLHFRDITGLVENGFRETLLKEDEIKDFASSHFQNLFNLIKNIELVIFTNKEIVTENFASTNLNFKNFEDEVKQQFESINKQHNEQFEKLSGQLQFIKKLIIGGVSISGLLGALWLGRFFLHL